MEPAVEPVARRVPVLVVPALAHAAEVAPALEPAVEPSAGGMPALAPALGSLPPVVVCRVLAAVDP